MDWDKQIYEWKEILDKIDREIDFFQKLGKKDVPIDEIKLALKPYDIYLTGGMCRVVLINNNLDTVLKISNKKENYNQVEVSNYKKAIKEGIDDYFCKCEDLGVMFGFFIEIMEKISPIDEDEISEELYGDKEPPEEFGSESWVLEELFDSYKLLTFLDSEGINDIHLGNIGYNNSGRIVILDYAGY